MEWAPRHGTVLLAAMSCIAAHGGCGRLHYQTPSSEGEGGSPGEARDAAADALVDADIDGQTEAGNLHAGSQACDWLPGPAFESVEHLASLSHPARELDPFLHSDERTLYFASNRNGSEDVFVSVRPSEDEPFGPPSSMSFNTPEQETRFEVTGSGLTGFLSSNWTDGSDDADLFMSTRRSVDDPFDDFRPLDALNTADEEFDPHISADARTLWWGVFDSTVRDQTVYRASRADTSAPFGAPETVPSLDMPDRPEGNVTLTDDGRVAVLSSSTSGEPADLFYSVRGSTDEPFSAPMPLDALNTSFIDWEPYIRGDGCELFFISDRAPEGGNGDLFRAVFRP